MFVNADEQLDVVDVLTHPNNVYGNTYKKEQIKKEQEDKEI